MKSVIFRKCDGNDDIPSEALANRKFVIQKQFESKFHQVAKNNVKDGHLLETMAFLVGIAVDGVYHSTELVFPNQISNSDMVEDIGMYFYWQIYSHGQ